MSPESRPLVDALVYRYLAQHLEHKRLVARGLQWIVAHLVERAALHDFSKFGADELEPYAAMVDRFAQAEYGSAEYRACCEAVRPAMTHHITTNSHHPEFYPGGIADMDLLDLTEMICDWVAAAQRAGGDTLRLDLQRERFAIEPQLYAILCRTARALAADIPGFQVIC